MSISITEARKKIRQFYEKNRRIPSYKEMCTLFRCASKSASYRLAQKLIEEGVLEKDKAGKLIPKRLYPSVPLLGSIAAGVPSPAQQQFLDSLSVSGYLVSRPERSFVLRVAGDSMIDAGINDGDLVIIEKDKEPRDGDVVAAEVDGDVTLKYLRTRKSRKYLSAANKHYSDIHPANSLSIFGVVVSVIRKYH